VSPPRGAPPLVDEDLVLPIQPGAAKLSRSAAFATVPVACSAACAGTVSATAAGSGGKARAAASRVLATRRFQATPGRPARVTLRFGAAARRAIRRAGGVRLTVRAAGARRVVTLRLRRR
jgi:hypothetical protein